MVSRTWIVNYKFETTR